MDELTDNDCSTVDQQLTLLNLLDKLTYRVDTLTRVNEMSCSAINRLECPKATYQDEEVEKGMKINLAKEPGNLIELFDEQIERMQSLIASMADNLEKVLITIG